MDIREATEEELGSAAALARRTFDLAVAPLYSAAGVITFHAYASEAGVRLRHAEGHLTVVAVADGSITGMAQLKDGMHLAMLFVMPEAQRQGIGRRLVEFILSTTGSQRLTVNSSPNAEAAYRRFGFRRTADEQMTDGIRFIPMQRPPGSGPHGEGTLTSAMKYNM